MTYFSLSKRHPEPEPDEELHEADEPEAEEEPTPEQAAAPTSRLGALVAGVCGPGAWIAARFGTGTAWTLHVVTVWACGFYGGWVAAGIVLGWLLLVGLFTPKERLDQAASWIEQHTPTVGPGEPEPKPTGEALTDPRHALARWLLDIIGDRPGIHLRELYPAMRNLPGQEGRTDAELRALLKGFGVRVSRSVRTGGIAGRSGVYRRHVEALLSPPEEPRPDSGGDAGQQADSPPLSARGEGV